ncbi:hypothetical protein Egran_01122 [Elaphomyces granulatus]|uniref:Uncharacterized protein n=1 Tax=Elaphomyces granulatus TaxID=519963 RepID=A0A232M3X3_9EURO|nr:hypothetical protein Egran_01122 [Elaphomyces granulatus]
MSKGSREVRVVDCRPEDKQDETVTFDSSLNATQRLTKVQRVADVAKKPHLKDPDPNLANITFLDWLQFYDRDKFHQLPKARPRVISCWPKYDPREDEGDDLTCPASLDLEATPFTSWSLIKLASSSNASKRPSPSKRNTSARPSLLKQGLHQWKLALLDAEALDRRHPNTQPPVNDDEGEISPVAKNLGLR